MEKQSYSVAGPEYKIKMWASVKCIWTTLQILYNKTAALPSLPIANQSHFGREAPSWRSGFEAGSHCAALDGRDRPMQTRLALPLSVSKSWVIGVHNYSLVRFQVTLYVSSLWNCRQVLWSVESAWGVPWVDKRRWLPQWDINQAAGPHLNPGSLYWA